ncbi:MAG: hypothetical protein ACYDCI_02950 [Candidatus Limnocylindrales bacterium]
MSLRGWFSVQQLALACLVGLIVGFGAFLLTAQASQDLMNVGCLPAVEAGFDPLTGLPHGARIECAQLTGAGGQIPVAQDIPMSADLATRRAIPVPLGFAVGAGLVLIVSTVSGVWQRRST